MSLHHHPSLIEPTIKYFLQEKLRECHNTRANIYLIIINVSVITIFIGLIVFTLYTIYINKPSEEEQREINLINQHIIMGKVRQFRENSGPNVLLPTITNEQYLSINSIR